MYLYFVFHSPNIAPVRCGGVLFLFDVLCALRLWSTVGLQGLASLMHFRQFNLQLGYLRCILPGIGRRDMYRVGQQQQKMLACPIL